jgi:uncharacterized protein
VILHLVEAEVWDRWPADEPYVDPSLAAEGFIHCTGDEPTLLAVANAVYRDVDGEVLALDIDVGSLTCEVQWETAAPAPPPGVAPDVLFPHVYGPIDRAAVVGIRRISRAADGTYTGYEART